MRILFCRFFSDFRTSGLSVLNLANYFFFIYIPFCDLLVTIDAAVTKKRPMCPVAVCFSEIKFFHMYFFFVVRGFINYAAKRIGYERASPEFHFSVLFKPNAVHTHYMNSICHRMAPLNGLPGIVLFGVGGFILRSCPTDCSRVK